MLKADFCRDLGRESERRENNDDYSYNDDYYNNKQQKYWKPLSH